MHERANVFIETNVKCHQNMKSHNRGFLQCDAKLSDVELVCDFMVEKRLLLN